MPGCRFRRGKVSVSLPPFENMRVSVRFPSDMDMPHSNQAAPGVVPPKLTLPFNTHEVAVTSAALFVTTVRASFVVLGGASLVGVPVVVNVWISPTAPRPSDDRYAVARK